MILLVLMALVGAVLGAIVRPRLIAIPLAIALAEGMRGLVSLAAPIAVDNDKAPVWATFALGVELNPVDGYLPLLAVSGGAALIAGLLTLLIDRPPPHQLTLDEATAVQRRVRNGRFVRADNMIEKHSVLNRAEARHKSLLGL